MSIDAIAAIGTTVATLGDDGHAWHPPWTQTLQALTAAANGSQRLERVGARQVVRPAGEPIGEIDAGAKRSGQAATELALGQADNLHQVLIGGSAHGCSSSLRCRCATGCSRRIRKSCGCRSEAKLYGSVDRQHADAHASDPRRGHRAHRDRDRGAVVVGLRTEYTVLFSRLTEADAAGIVAELKKQKVDYQLADGGSTIRVPAPRVHDVRLALMSSGTPIAGGVGFEIFDRQGLGATEQSQRVSYPACIAGRTRAHRGRARRRAALRAYTSCCRSRHCSGAIDRNRVPRSASSSSPASCCNASRSSASSG